MAEAVVLGKGERGDRLAEARPGEEVSVMG
jgi:hypothetical protein